MKCLVGLFVFCFVMLTPVFVVGGALSLIGIPFLGIFIRK